MRPDRLYLADIAQAADDIARLVAGQTEESFIQSMPLRRACLQAITEIGEAAARLSPELKARYPDAPWREAVGMRNFAVHQYFGVDWRIAWHTAAEDIPALRRRVEAILREEFPEGRG